MNNDLRHLVLSGERPLFGLQDARLTDVTIGEGESGLKRVRRIEAKQCRFEGMYILWETEDVLCNDCVFEVSSRASLWYGKRLVVNNCRILSPKCFREIDGLRLTGCAISDGQETFWMCRNGQIDNLVLEQAQYCFLHAANIRIHNTRITGKYAFQYARNIEIHNAVIDTKDAFWESDNCTVYDSEIRGEYLAWYSRNLRLVRCRLIGTQPLCYCRNLTLEDCSLDPSADRCFEFSDVRGNLLGGIPDMTPPYNISDLKFLKDSSQ